ncbi:hypothetical protein TanjilG_15279 [Lupinus angustifolius]|uniref:C2H2-type domain-containing protein n=1 Tax=Lupinus angustifolius TaxID=3871 RepID=A0A1J7I9S8_LUPAN|nr:PREDICTED: transcriptional regulator SUPERMAN-like [Lupinus angustifolius]OIW11585.1 hypothetical protein TanjilG_15279 [Lupinus angustifolius]
MKRNSLSTNYGNNYHNTKNQMVMKEFLDCNNSHNGEDIDHYMNGYPWPPRSYTCSFCMKEFKSAQALGGHMNVHRRDRARLRQSSPPTPTTDNHHGHVQGHPMMNLNPNTNPSFSSSTSSNLPLLPASWSSHHSSSNKPSATSTLPLFVSPTTLSSYSYSSPSTASPSELNRWVVVDGILLKNPSSTKTTEPTKPKIGEDHGCKMLKKGEILRMDLEIGMPREYDLDLELRLGNYS